MKNPLEKAIEESDEKPKGQFNFKDIISAIDKKSNPLEKMSLELARTMFDDRKLLMTARLKLGYAKMIIRNIIVNHFFLKYYGECACNIRLKKTFETKRTSKFPMYDVISRSKRPDDVKKFQNSFAEFNKNLLKITVSFEGKGRDEIIKILEAQMGASAQENNGLFGWKKPFGG